MRDIRVIRIFLTTIFLVATLAWLLIGPQVNPLAAIAVKSQIIPSALPATIGVTAFWLVVTFIFGRIYCSTVCPLGTLQDVAVKCRGRKRPFSYAATGRFKWPFLALYLICLVIGITAAGWLIEPWNVVQSAAAAVRPADVSHTWGLLTHGILVGVIAGLIVLVGVLVWAYLSGRRFCTEVCPIGTMLGAVSERSLMHIAIDPDKCINCMKCEDVCPSRCIKVVSRYVDDPRCVRCFDCLKVCPNDAIRYRINRTRRGTPLMQRRRHLT